MPGIPVSDRNGWKQRLGRILVTGLCLAALGLPQAARAAAPVSPDHPVEQAAMTAMAAAVCAGSYHPENSREIRYLEDYGWTMTPYTLKDGDTEVNFTLARKQGLLRGKNWTVLAFRGSATRDDWKLNMKMKAVPYPEGSNARKNQDGEEKGPAVHEGFLRYARAALSSPWMWTGTAGRKPWRPI